MSIVLIGIL